MVKRFCLNPNQNPKCKSLVTENSNLCRSCRFFRRVFSEESLRKMKEAHQGTNKGEKNPFYGKKHDEETKARMSESARGRSEKIAEWVKKANRLGISGFSGRRHTAESRKKMSDAQTRRITTEETRRKLSEGNTGRKASLEARKKMSESQKNRPPCSEETKKKLRESWTRERREKQAKSMRGSGNRMYGRPSPIGSGSGIGGWYNGIHFRSSSELAFLLYDKSADWINAEGLEFRISYMNQDGKNLHYCPDFFDKDGLRLVEVKPPDWRFGNRYWRDIPEKMSAGCAFCKAKNWSYAVVEMRGLSKSRIYKLRRDGVVLLDERWEKKYQKWINGS